MNKLVFTSVAIFLLQAAALAGGIFRLTPDTLERAAKAKVRGGITLTDNWKFSPNDNPAFADPLYNDSSWFPVKSYFTADTIPAMKWKGFGWFRYSLLIDSSLANKSLALLLFHMGASEIYVNGRKIRSFGKVATYKQAEEAYDPQGLPVSFFTGSDSLCVIAVRYSNLTYNSSFSKFAAKFSTDGFRVMVQYLDEAIERRYSFIGDNALIQLTITGIVAALSLVHILLFLFYSREKSHAYYSIFTCSLGLVFLGSFVMNYSHAVLINYIGMLVNFFAVIIHFLFFTGFLFSIYYKKLVRRFYLYALLGAVVAASPLFPVRESAINYAIYAYFIITLLDGLLVILLAMKKKIDGAWIIGIGVLGFFLLMAFVFTVNFFRLQNSMSTSVIVAVSYFGFISVPVAMAVYLARGFARTNTNLEQKLQEIKQLSENALEQERREAELKLEKEKEEAKLREAELRAHAAEFQVKAAEAQAMALQAENTRKSKELDDARRLQLSMLPTVIPQVAGLDIAVYMKTATEVGGDYYDFALSPDGTLTVCLGDATGHGARAGVMVTVAKSLFTAYAGKEDLPEILSAFNHSIRQMNMGILYMSMGLGRFTPGKLQYASAGMPPLLVRKAATKHVEQVTIKAMPAGAFAGYKYEMQEVELNTGDYVLFMSDGFTELFNKQKEMLGLQGAVDVFRGAAGNDAATVLKRLVKTVETWCAGGPPEDDVTFVLVRVC